MTDFINKQAKVNWTSVIVYYVIACAISWPFFWWRDMNAESWGNWNLPGFVKTYSYMWGPGISAIICLFLFRKTHNKTISFFGTSLIKSLIFYLLPILALTISGISSQNMNPHLFPLVLGLMGFISILGEELGWRGFLQDALRPLTQIKRYALIGAMWELWHFTNRMGHGEIIPIIIRVTIFIVALSILSFLIGKATDQSKSLIVAVTLHAWIDILAEFNNTGTWIVFGLSVPFWIYLIGTWNKKLPQKVGNKNKEEGASFDNKSHI